jgi:hypothetical protein
MFCRVRINLRSLEQVTTSTHPPIIPFDSFFFHSTVALIAQSGGCSIFDKVKVASSMITPSNTVGFLIVQDASKRHNFLDDGDDVDDNVDESFSVSLESFELKLAEQNGRALIQIPEDDGAQEQLQLQQQQIPSNSRTLEGGLDDVNLAVLHVSFGTGLALFDTLVRESQVDMRQGGKRVLLNGKENAFFVNPVLACILIISFCCLLLCVHKAFDIEEPEQPQAPRRPRRRRLTLEEVRARFPSYHFHPGQQHQLPNSCRPSEMTSEAACEQQQQQHGYMQLSDECTICLDEFAPGVRVRKLPCDHIFHSTCIARWLIERSAVCPLCKLDLYIDPEEEDENESSSDEGTVSQQQLLLQHGQQSQGSLSVWSRLWTGATVHANDNNDNEGYTQLEVPTGAPSENDIAGSEEQRSWWPFSLETVPSTDEEEGSEIETTNVRSSASSSLLATTAFALSSWTRNAFGINNNNRRRHLSSNNETSNILTELTEPLISQASLEEEQQLQPSPTAADQTQTTSSETNAALVVPETNDNNVLPSAVAEI